ncbi:XrtA system polysaccharide chain length determinant [Lysobacter niabensis]|uniref:XrtA system polysaccharide chain length determinant n=1 Tax=Agrilutibacter niabensis TaxID=380628 RepID=UPI00361F5C33
MNDQYGQLSLPGPGGERLPTLTLLAMASKEFRRYVLPLATIFAAIALFFLVWGLLNPSTYKSSATVLVQDNTAIVPLMEGRAATPNDASRAIITRDVLFGRRVMQDVLQVGGWMADDPSPVEQERLINSIIGRTEISVTDRVPVRSTDPKLSLVKISYSDSDAKRAYAVTKRFSEALIEQVLEAKSRASRSAYQFIDAQVETYQHALGEADKKLREYRSENPDAMPGVDADVSSRIAELRRAADNASMDLADVGAQERQLMGQLSRESQLTTISRSAQTNVQLATLQAEQDRLMLNYTDQHPDVVRVRNQIRDLQSQARSGRSSGVTLLPGATPSMNPVYQQLRTQLAEVRRQGAASASRLATAQALLREEIERSRKILGDEGNVTALTRAQEVNKEMYEDLLKRRENARVSMSLDADGRSLGFQIQEPATVPLLATGLRLTHFAAAGLLLAIIVPLLMLSMLVKHDPRVRSPLQIERDAGLPVLGTIPLHMTQHQTDQHAKRLRLGMILFASVPAIYGVVLILKMANVL